MWMDQLDPSNCWMMEPVDQLLIMRVKVVVGKVGKEVCELLKTAIVILTARMTRLCSSCVVFRGEEHDISLTKCGIFERTKIAL